MVMCFLLNTAFLNMDGEERIGGSARIGVGPRGGRLSRLSEPDLLLFAESYPRLKLISNRETGFALLEKLICSKRWHSSMRVPRVLRSCSVR